MLPAPGTPGSEAMGSPSSSSDPSWSLASPSCVNSSRSSPTKWRLGRGTTATLAQGDSDGPNLKGQVFGEGLEVNPENIQESSDYTIIIYGGFCGIFLVYQLLDGCFVEISWADGALVFHGLVPMGKPEVLEDP